MSKFSRLPGLRLAVVAFSLVLLIGLGVPSASALWHQSLQAKATVLVPKPEPLEATCAQLDIWNGIDDYFVLLETNKVGSNKRATNRTYQGVSKYSGKAFGERLNWPDTWDRMPLWMLNSVVKGAMKDHENAHQMQAPEFSFTVRITAEYDGWQQTADADLTVLLTDNKIRPLFCANPG